MNTPRTDEAILTEPYQIKELSFEVVKASKMAELETELQTMTAQAVDPTAICSALQSLPCFWCRKPVTDQRKLASPGARNVKIVFCDQKCLNQFTAATGCV